MYSSIDAGFLFGLSVLITISYQYVPEYYPVPPPRDPPDQAEYYTDDIAKIWSNITEGDGLTQKWACAGRPVLYMRWPDRMHRPNQSDLWFDRLIYIHHEGNYDFVVLTYTDYKHKNKILFRKRIVDLSVTLNGVIFDDDRVLTSYNPFRQIIKYAFKRHFTHVCALEGRVLKPDNLDSSTRYVTTFHNIGCARQVVPLEETYEMPLNLWHGRANRGDYLRQHSPIHDLMVVRIQGYFKDLTKENYDFEYSKSFNGKWVWQGPQKTILAKKDDVMGSDFKFAMMGHIFRDPTKPPIKHMSIQYLESTEGKEELKTMRDTYVGRYNESENVLTNCDEWIPREWGWFICVLNKQGLRRLASGAALYSRGLLFGMGSFTLFKGNESIIVFTDVRPYESLITNNVTGPCTTTDQFGTPH